MRPSCMKRTNAQPNPISRLAASVLAVAGVMALAACFGGNDSEERAPATTAAMAVVSMRGGRCGIRRHDGSRKDDAGFVCELEYSSGGFDIGVIGRDVIIEMRVLVSSDNIQRTVASIMANVSALGGGVAYSNIDYGDRTDGHDDGFAMLVVKVPPGGIDQLLAGLDDTGTVHSISQSAQDVTEIGRSRRQDQERYLGKVSQTFESSWIAPRTSKISWFWREN